MRFNWQQADWPEFAYSLHGVEDLLFDFAEEAGFVGGLVQALSGDTQLETLVSFMIAEAIKTSEIEGEFLNRQDVMSSIRNGLGLNAQPQRTKDKKAAGAGELMVMVRSGCADPLTDEMLFAWHRTLMADSKEIATRAWRSSGEPMQIVSGAYGHWKVHFEAPPSSAVPHEMKRFVQWFNSTAPDGERPLKKAPVRAAIAHLYFETIHPFEDGNGRIGRAIAEKALSQTIGRPVMLSLSKAIEANRKAYYDALGKAQQSNEISSWMAYFIPLVLAAQQESRAMIHFTLQKTKFFDRFGSLLNARQLKAINRMFEEDPDGFEGGMNAAKYSAVTKAPKATATRDLQALLQLGAFTVEGGGRSTRYHLNLKSGLF